MERAESLAEEIRSHQRVSHLPKFTNLARYCLAIGAAKNGDLLQAMEIARHWEDTPAVFLTLRAAASPGGLTMPWGSQLGQYGISAELVEALLPVTVLGRMSGSMRKIPFRTSVARETSVAAGAWIEEGIPIPSRKATFDLVRTEAAKCATIVVLTRDLVKFGVTPNPNTEAEMRSQLVRGVARFLDTQFLDPTVAPVVGVKPGSIFWRADKVTSSGSTAAQILADLLAMVGKLTATDTPFAAPYWIMKPSTAIALAGKYTTAGTLAFPGISAGGGTLLGIPTLTTNNSPQQIGLVDASQILLSDDGNAEIDASDEAALQLDDSPTPGAAAMTSLFQNNLFGLRAIREMAWAPAQNAGSLDNSPVDFVPHGATYMTVSY